MEYACDYLARVGLAALVDDLGGPTEPEWADEDDPAAVAASEQAARLADHARVRGHLLAAPPLPRSGGLLGAKWVRLITWPDRVPGLKTWAGQATLPKLIAKRQAMLAKAPPGDLLAARAWSRKQTDGGPSGIDPGCCRDAVDVGFSPSRLGMDVEMRPGVELLAVVGLEAVPLVSFGLRECGFLHAGRAWRFAAEERDGGYSFRWGELREYAPAEVA